MKSNKLKKSWECQHSTWWTTTWSWISTQSPKLSKSCPTTNTSTMSTNSSPLTSNFKESRPRSNKSSTSTWSTTSPSPSPRCSEWATTPKPWSMSWTRSKNYRCSSQIPACVCSITSYLTRAKNKYLPKLSINCWIKPLCSRLVWTIET